MEFLRRGLKIAGSYLTALLPHKFSFIFFKDDDVMDKSKMMHMSGGVLECFTMATITEEKTQITN